SKPIRQLRIGEEVNVIGRVTRVEKGLTRRRQSMITVTLYDGTGYLNLTFFGQPWLAGTYKVGIELGVSGRVQMYRRMLQLANQEVKVLGGDEADTVDTGGIIPASRPTAAISGRTFRERVHGPLERISRLPPRLPAAIS